MCYCAHTSIVLGRRRQLKNECIEQVENYRMRKILSCRETHYPKFRRFFNGYFVLLANFFCVFSLILKGAMVKNSSVAAVSQHAETLIFFFKQRLI